MAAKELAGKIKKSKFVRYSEGCEMYSMSLNKFKQLARDANAIYKLDRLVLVNTEILDAYMESFRICEDF